MVYGERKKSRGHALKYQKWGRMTCFFVVKEFGIKKEGGPPERG
jgi:hypothetical protein